MRQSTAHPKLSAIQTATKAKPSTAANCLDDMVN